MQKRFRIAGLCCCFVCFLGCDGAPDLDQSSKIESSPVLVESKQIVRWPKRELEERDFEIIRFVLASFEQTPGERTRFLTTTPHEYWDREGGWESLPPEFHATLDSAPLKYLPADQAQLDRGYVFEKTTHTPGLMIWIRIKQWISPTEVEIETGSWSGPLDAVGATTIYEKLDGQWRVKEVIRKWIS